MEQTMSSIQLAIETANQAEHKLFDCYLDEGKTSIYYKIDKVPSFRYVNVVKMLLIKRGLLVSTNADTGVLTISFAHALPNEIEQFIVNRVC